MEGDVDEDERDCECQVEEPVAAGPRATVTIVVEARGKRARMTVSGSEVLVDEALVRFWRGLHYDV